MFYFKVTIFAMFPEIFTTFYGILVDKSWAIK